MQSRLLLYNARVVLPECVLDPGYVVIENDTIVEVAEGQRVASEAGAIDVRGQYLMPGIIDMHSDAIEKEARPRPQVVLNVGHACRELERRLAGAGITTVYHSVSFAASTGIRSNDWSQNVLNSLVEYSQGEHLIDNRIHFRYEITNDQAPEIIDRCLTAGTLSMISFTDHTPGQGQYTDVKEWVKYVRNTYNLSEVDLLNLAEAKCQQRAQLNMETVYRTALRAGAAGVVLASHDNDSVESVETSCSMGVSIAEFPINLKTARHAKNLGLHVAVGAPNVLTGGSHNNNLSAERALMEDCADMLCSDYYPPAMLQAVFKMADKGFGLPRACCLATLNPAKACGLDDRLGSIQAGKRADIIIAHVGQGRPVVSMTVTRGRIVSSFSYHRYHRDAASTAWSHTATCIPI